MRAGEGHGLEVLLGVDAVLLQEKARHQAARGGRGRAKGKALAPEVGQGLDGGVGRDELGGEPGVFLALHDGDGRAVGADLGLHEGEAAQPGQVQLARGQRLDHGGVVGHGREHHLHAGLGREVLAQRLELALQLGGSFIRDGRDAQHGGFGGQRRQAGQGGGGQHAGSRLAQRRAARRNVVHGWAPFNQPPPSGYTAV